jgi:ribosomal 50S subunit-associated protein YjgA (DUF615 family)
VWNELWLYNFVGDCIRHRHYQPILLMILQNVSFNSERKHLLAEIEALRNRFMANDFHDYATGKHILSARPPTDVEQVEKMLGVDDEGKQRADRLPVS